MTRPEGTLTLPSRIARSLLLLAAALCSLAPNPGSKPNGRVLKVDPTQPTAFQTIAQAVAAARQFDTIDLSPAGSPYLECVDVERRFDLRITSRSGAVIDGTGACPSSQPAFRIALSRHVFVQNIELRGNPAGSGFLVDHSGDIRFQNVTARNFSGCGLVSTLSVVGVTVDLSRFTDNPGGGMCLNGNGLWVTNTQTARNGNGGMVLQGVFGGAALNAFVSGLGSGSDQPAGILAQSPAGLNNVNVLNSTFGTRGVPANPGAVGVAGSGRNLEMSRSRLYGLGLQIGASGMLSSNMVLDCVGTGFSIGPGPLGMTLLSNTAQGCTGTGFDLAGASAMRSRAMANSGGGFLARDGVFLERNAASANGGAGFSRVGADNGGRGNASTDPVPPEFR